jgi:hypothetical protein
MKANLWNSLEALSTQAALLTEWERELGDDFAASRMFLQPTQQQAESYPCSHPISCGCRHRVIFESPDDVSAVCDCAEGGCEPFFLGACNLIIHALDKIKLAAAIRQAFQLDEIQSGGFQEVRSCLVGGWGVRRSRVFFYVPISESGLLKEIDRLCAAMPDPFVLLTLTSLFCTPMVQRALRRQGAAQIALADVVKLTAPGVLELIPTAKIAVDAFFGDFGKQVAQGKPLQLAIARVEAKLDAIAKSRNQTRTDDESLPEEVARQAVAMVKQLDTTNRLKKPSILTVFRLYCINEMSATEIAAQCGCSKASIMKRLKILSLKTGTPAARLRRYSAQFERMEAEMGDWRAKRIHRQRMAEGEADDDAETD